MRTKPSTLAVCCAALLFLVTAGCSHVTTARLQPDSVDVGERLEPMAAIQADAISWYVLFIPIPGVDLDQVVNRMLIATAKGMGADKVANLTFEITPDKGIWALRKLFLWRGARASGIAVRVTDIEPDPEADEGPEPATTGQAPPPPAASADDAATAPR